MTPRWLLQLFWFVPTHHVWKVSYSHNTYNGTSQPPDVIALDDSKDQQQGMIPGAYRQLDLPPAGIGPGIQNDAVFWSNLFESVVFVNAAPATLPARRYAQANCHVSIEAGHSAVRDARPGWHVLMLTGCTTTCAAVGVCRLLLTVTWCINNTVLCNGHGTKMQTQERLTHATNMQLTCSTQFETILVLASKSQISSVPNLQNIPSATHPYQ